MKNDSITATPESTNPSKVALITGSGKPRLGNHIARALALHGYRIAIHFNSSATQAYAFADELELAGHDAAAFQADISQVKQIDKLVDQVLETFGRIDVLVNTASVWKTIPFEDITEEDLQQQFDVDLKGTFFCSRRVGLQMVEQASGGAIINFCDWAISRPYPQHAAYFAVKGAVPTMTRALARELAERNPKVRVNCIQPGPVLLPPGTDPHEMKTLVESTLVRQVDRPDSIANAVRYLAEDTFLTGVCLPVDGGRSIYAAGETR